MGEVGLANFMEIMRNSSWLGVVIHMMSDFCGGFCWIGRHNWLFLSSYVFHHIVSPFHLGISL